MAVEEPQVEQAPETPASRRDQLEGGTYEIIRSRLLGHGKELGKRIAQLNQARKEVFGSVEPALIATERVTTEHNCVPRDITPIGKNQFIFGYNVYLGLKSQTELSDVFAVYEYRDGAFHSQELEVLRSGEFEKDFQQLYKYYKETRFAKFRIIGPHLFMVFRVGKSIGDIKTFKWLKDEKGLTYLGNRFDHEFSFPPQHDFVWKRTHRDFHQEGLHPHISIENKVFVETLGGDLTIKIENNTDSGEGIYSEPVENQDQTLDDAEIFYAVVGNLVLLKIKPFQEKKFRYFVFNHKLKQVKRIDKIEDACVLLPDAQGLIFPDGYYLQNGEYKVFDNQLSPMVFSRCVSAPNGEDHLYVFYNRMSGVYILFSYNVIEQSVRTPVICHGYSIFENGELVYFKGIDEPQRHHALQVWRTPFVGPNVVADIKDDSGLFKIGNRDLVRCMAECHEVLALLRQEDSYENLYLDLVRETESIVDSYFWIDKKETFQIKEPLQEIRKAAEAAIEEFEKVSQLKKEASRRVGQAVKQTGDLLRGVDVTRFEQIDRFVEYLASLRSLRGEIISLRDLRYADLSQLDSLEKEITGETAKASEGCVAFLLKPEALQPYRDRAQSLQREVAGTATVMEVKRLGEEMDTFASGLEMLIDIVGNLPIEDSTQTTQIIDDISSVYSSLNQSRADLKNRRKDLMSTEAVAQFGAQIKLVSQAVVNYLDVSDSAAKCDEYLTKLMVQIEELEGQFSEFDEFTAQIAEKRDEIYNAFEARKLQLIETRNRRASALAQSAERILNGIRNRVERMESINDINAYLASDLMVEKVRNVVAQLLDLEDSVKADDIQSRLKTIREDAVRQLKDRQELFVDGKNVIRFGQHRFSVNTQVLDLTMVKRDEDMCIHLMGTNYFSRVTDETFLKTREIWRQELASENESVYRAEYLAFQMLKNLGACASDEIDAKIGKDRKQSLPLARELIASRYSEGYVKGVHDHDASAIFEPLWKMHESLGLLRFPSRVRACALTFWQWGVGEGDKALLAAKLRSFGNIAEIFPGRKTRESYVAELRARIEEFNRQEELFPVEWAEKAAHYLFEQLASLDKFAVSDEAAGIRRTFQESLKTKGYAACFADARAAVQSHPKSHFDLLRDWVGGYLAHADNNAHASEYLDEACVLLLGWNDVAASVPGLSSIEEVKGLKGDHRLIQKGAYGLNYHDFMDRLEHFEHVQVPLFHSYQNSKRNLLERSREELRLDEFKPRVLTSFVRNKLIDSVYLPLVGDNLAKQLGGAGENKRTDRMGLLLVISPPGYGKTTLMEYVANRLGIVFMKINGPALGHRVLSLDPQEAPNASAREEVEKLNLAFEMGDNVMIYLDDIQHCNPEFLQKFISLCDAQRKIEGVHNGQPRTYDLRGKKVAVVMAGNPYTESGEKFQIPDMLANRADTYNLGDIIGDSEDAFKMSYLENAVTSNPVLNQLASRSQKDIYSVIQIAETGSRDGVDFEGNFSTRDIEDMVSVMKKLIQIREVILRVNQEYIRSAAQADAYRTEPAFKLQGSYRNMNRLAEKVVPIMNEKELQRMILDDYTNEAQTLTSGAEANLLKFKEITGTLTQEEEERWNHIKSTFQTNLRFDKAGADDPVGRVVVELAAFTEGLEEIKKVLALGLNEKKTAQPVQPPVPVQPVSQPGVADRETSQPEAVYQQPTRQTASGPYQVEIVYSLPDAVNQLLDRQGHLMEILLGAVGQSTQFGVEQVKKLETKVGTALREYRQLVKDLKAHTAPDTGTPPAQ